VTAYLIDNSAWVREADGDPAFMERIADIRSSPADFMVTCPPQVLEYCHSARGKEDYTEYRDAITLGFPLEIHPTEDDVLDTQEALWEGGLARSARAMDILIAAYAILNNAVVLHCDHDYEYIAQVVPLQQEYLTPTEPLREVSHR